uniref:UrcA family protein n=1 Tax=uncultured Caulobacter sp. TaxID=158749 RepID=UPI0025E91A42|nr:UrcA family protein [uncultured Caulobacter sp.]
MRKFIMSLTTVASLSLAAVPVLGLTQAANAAEPGDPSITVSIADLNLANPAQAKIFKARVQAAGETVCRAKMNRGELQSTVRACMTEARQSAERQLSQRQRNALALAKTAPVEVAAQ